MNDFWNRALDSTMYKKPPFYMTLAKLYMATPELLIDVMDDAVSYIPLATTIKDAAEYGPLLVDMVKTGGTVLSWKHAYKFIFQFHLADLCTRVHQSTKNDTDFFEFHRLLMEQLFSS